VKALDTKAMRDAEEAAVARGVPRLLMMENAGRALAGEVLKRFDPSFRPSVLVVAGSGNNGGDGGAAARQLHDKPSVTVILLGGTSKVKAEEAALQWRVLSTMGDVRMVEALSADALLALKPLFESNQVIVDAIFGTGVRGEVGEPQASAIKLINSSNALRIAVDIPSGLDPDTGEDHGLVVRADVTVTLHAPKPGLAIRPDVVGQIVVEGIGIP